MEQFETTLRNFDVAMKRADAITKDKRFFRRSAAATACERFVDAYRTKYEAEMEGHNDNTSPILHKMRMNAHRFCMKAITKCAKFEVGESLMSDEGKLRYTPEERVNMEEANFLLDRTLKPFDLEYRTKTIKINKPDLISEWPENFEIEWIKDLQGFVFEIPGTYEGFAEVPEVKATTETEKV